MIKFFKCALHFFLILQLNYYFNIKYQIISTYMLKFLEGKEKLPILLIRLTSLALFCFDLIIYERLTLHTIIATSPY